MHPNFNHPCQKENHKSTQLYHMVLGGELIKPEIKKNAGINLFFLEPFDVDLVCHMYDTVCYRCRHLLVAAHLWLLLLAGSDICVFKIPSGPLVYFWFLGSKLYGTDSVPVMSLSSSLSWCDFPTFFVCWP